MRLSLSKSKNATSFYVIKDVIEGNKRTTKIVEKLGTLKELEENLNGRDPYEWAKEYIEELNKKEEKQKRDVIVKFSQSKIIDKGLQNCFNGGYLFLQDIYHSLGIDRICNSISDKYKFTYDLDSILSRLIYGRILFPSSKLNTYEESKSLMEGPNFELQHIYRGLEVISSETDFIQSELYKNSLSFSKRNDKILYYDCTNYFFEIEQEEGIKQYGFGKDHKPNPIVGMGLFMDGDGIPLAFSIYDGNSNEQTTLKPLEEKILKDFNLSKFIVCTDAGLSSLDNRRFNDKKNRAFITTQSIKKLKKHLKEWALDPTDWCLIGDKGTYDISKLDVSEEIYEKYKSRTFYKERWIKENGLEQKLIVTFSLKYRDYQRQIRGRQIDRAIKMYETRPSDYNKKRQNDYKRFIDMVNVTDDGEIADKKVYRINTKTISEEEMFDGFYGICTNLDEGAEVIAKINHRRWEIEECFRIMKSEFKARPVYLSRDDRIKAHFTTCFLALVIYRYLEKHLEEKYTSVEIIGTLREMNFKHIRGEGYIPNYTRTDITDALHEAFNFRTDYEIVSFKNMKNIFRETKKKKILRSF